MGKIWTKTTVNIDRFHMELAGSPFDMTFNLKTPMSDPDFKGSMIGKKLTLERSQKPFPWIVSAFQELLICPFEMAGRLSMIEKEKYESFKATGKNEYNQYALWQ